MTNPSNGGAPMVDDSTSVQAIDAFAGEVASTSNEGWITAIEQAEQNVVTAGLSGDPDITTALTAMKEAAGALAATGTQLKTAMSKHVVLAEHVSETQNHGTKIQPYQNQ